MTVVSDSASPWQPSYFHFTVCDQIKATMHIIYLTCSLFDIPKSVFCFCLSHWWLPKCSTEWVANGCFLCFIFCRHFAFQNPTAHECKSLDVFSFNNLFRTVGFELKFPYVRLRVSRLHVFACLPRKCWFCFALLSFLYGSENRRPTRSLFFPFLLSPRCYRCSYPIVYL